MAEQGQCCGLKVSAWAGGPLVAGCALCEHSPTYWRRPANRGGTPFEPVPLAEAYRRVPGAP